MCIVLTLVTIFMGSFMGCTENGLKKRLAYSSISQISYVLLGVFLMTPVGLLGGLLQLLFHFQLSAHTHGDKFQGGTFRLF